MDDNWLKLILLIIMSIALLAVFFLGGWKWGSKLCSCCRRSKKPVADSEAGIEMADNTKLNLNKDAKQKSENDAVRERAKGTGFPHGTSMAEAGLGTGHPRVASFEAIKPGAKVARELDRESFKPPPGVDELVFNANDLRESEEAHPHEIKKLTPVSKKATALDFEDIDLNPGHAVKPREML